MSVGDIKADNTVKPSFLEERIKASKTNVFRKGVSVYLGVTGTDLCPVAAILSYMTLQGKTAADRKNQQEKPAPFFRFSDGSPLTRDKLVAELRRPLRAAGLDDSNFAGHSFRI